MSVFKQLMKHSAIYSASNILARMVSFLMIPIYTRFLSPSDYGIIEMLDLTVNIVSTVVGLRINGALFRFYYEYKEPRDRNELMSTALIFVSGLTLAVTAVLCLSTGWFSGLLFKTDSYSGYFLIAFVTLFFQIVVEYCFVYVQVRQRSLSYAVISLSRLVMGLGLNIFFVVYLKKGPLGILYSGLITSMVSAAVLATITVAQVGLGFSKEKLAKMLSFGFPLVFSSFSTFVLTFSDRYFLNHFSPLSAVGIYALSYKFGILVNYLVTGPFISIWGPKRFEIVSQGEGKADVVSMKAFTYFSFVLLFAGLGVCVLIKDIVKVMAPPEYYPAHMFVPLIVLASIFNAAYYHLNFGIYMKKRTGYIAYIWTSAAVLNIILNYFLIRSFHSMGAAVATVISYAYVALATNIISQRIYPVTYEVGRVLKMFVLAVGIYLASLAVHIDSPFASVPVRMGMILLFPVGLYFAGFFKPSEKDALLGAVRGGWRKAAGAFGRKP